jgi:hypothetical protein
MKTVQLNTLRSSDWIIEAAVQRDRSLIAKAFAQFPWQIRGNARLKRGTLPQVLAKAFDGYMHHLNQIHRGKTRWVYVVESPWDDPHVHFRLMGLNMTRYPIPRLLLIAHNSGLGSFDAEPYDHARDTGYDVKYWTFSEYGDTNAWRRGH